MRPVGEGNDGAWRENGAVPLDYRARIVADSRDRVAWLRERAHGVTATDAAKLANPRAVRAVAMEKLLGSGFSGNSYTAHGRAREPEIAEWARAIFGMQPSTSLFHAAQNRGHLATPDGLREHGEALELCEIKTTSADWSSIPRPYLRQVWWQQHVLGAERTLVVWERHRDFVPVDDEPHALWVDRDDAEIARLIALADDLLVAIRRDA